MAAIVVHNLAKQYSIGKLQSDLRGSIAHRLKNIFTSSQHDSIWAIKDISFSLEQGETLGIIGHNGAGKTTLLKILSRITYPTKGRIEIDGRIASLLEVGTGFHQELTGRENVFLNGTILGMKRQEIKKKFDEIVDFSGIEKFIDTPVKHYSSGMAVRLAFSVAAHLDPEILCIDEVLAIGDAEFQKKCMSKMNELTHKEKRTLLFVSHNMAAIKSLCEKTMLLNNGMLHFIGNTNEAIAHYLNMHQSVQSKEIVIAESSHRKGLREVYIHKIAFDKAQFFPEDDIDIALHLKSKNNQKIKDLVFDIRLLDMFNVPIYNISNRFTKQENIFFEAENVYHFKIKRNALKQGQYKLHVFVSANGADQDEISDPAVITILDGNIYNYPNSSMIVGAVQPSFEFYTTNKNQQ